MTDTLPGLDPVGVKPFDWLRRVLDDPDTTLTDRAAVAAILLYAPARPRRDRAYGAQSGWDFFLSHAQLAGDMQAGSTKTAQRCLSHLCKLGYLTQVKRGHGVPTASGEFITQASVWRLALPAIGHESPIAAANYRTGGSASA